MRSSKNSSGDLTLAEFLPQYQRQAAVNLKPKTLVEYQRLLSRLILPAFGSKRLSSIASAEIEKWHTKLRAKTPAQANRALAVLSSVLKLAARWGLIPVNPALGTPIAKEKPRERYLAPSELKALSSCLDALAPVEAAFIRVALLTGARPGELVSADWSQYTGATIELPDSKTGRGTIYLSPEAQTILGPMSRDLGPMFPGVNPTLLWRKVRRQTGITARLYDLRHTFASAALSRGLSMATIQLLMRHTSYRTTQRYAHLTTQTGQEAVAKVAGLLAA